MVQPSQEDFLHPPFGLPDRGVAWKSPSQILQVSIDTDPKGGEQVSTERQRRSAAYRGAGGHVKTRKNVSADDHVEYDVALAA
jgi:hypothetical protein